MNKLVVTYRGSRYYKNGWVVGSVKINEVIEQDDNFEFKEGRLLNIRGTTGFEPRIDGEYKLVGELQNDKTWGPQLEILSMNEKVSLETDEDKRYFLKQILTENQVEELYATYEDPFNLLENGDIASLIKVKGIGDIMAQKLIARFESTVDNAPAYVYFKKFDVTNNLVKKLISVYGGAAELINAFKKNPYILIDDVDGIGFLKADEIALKSGLQKDSPIRVEQGIYYILNKEAQENGCTWVSPSAFKSHIVKLLGINFDEIKPVFKDMKDSNEIYISKDKTRIALYKYYQLEKSISDKIKKMCSIDTNMEDKKIIDEINDNQIGQGFEFTDEQVEGIHKVLENNIVVITGGAGVGKTTVVKGFLAALPDNCNIAQTSFSGQASKRMSEATGYPAATIHRLLGYIPDKGFTYDEENKLPYDVVILDECSMLPIDLFWYLIRAIRDNAKLIILGDNKQLPPIGVGNLFTDLLDSPTVPKQVLTKIHRQAAKSAIITTSIEVRNRKQIVDVNEDGEKTLGELQDLTMCSYQDKDDIFKRAIEAFKEEYKKHPYIKDIQIIVPMRERGELSQLAFNNAIQKMINPQDNKYVKTNKNFVIKEGDKIINRKNNYKLFDINYQPVQVFNGSMGIVEEIYDDYMIIDFFDIGKVRIPSDLYRGLQLGYALTCHSCLPGDTIISTTEGLKTLKELDNGAEIGEFKNINNDIKVFNGKYFEKPKSFYNNGTEDIYEVKTRRGYSVSTTLNHKFNTWDRDGFVKKELKEVKEGEYLALNKNINYYFNQIDIPKYYYNFKVDVRAKRYNLPEKLTPALCRLLGCIVADGTIKHKLFRICKSHYDYCEMVVEDIKKVFGFQAKIQKSKNKNMYFVEVNSSYITEFLMKFDGLMPNNKYIPNLILKTTKGNQCAFLQGLFEDGTVNLKKDKFDHIEFSQKNKFCIEQVKMMLLNMGIITSQSVRRKTTKNGIDATSYILYIYKKDAIVFRKEIGFMCNFKNDRLKLILDNSSCFTCSNRYIPYIKRLIIPLLNKYDGGYINNLNTYLKKDVFTDVFVGKILDIFKEHRLEQEEEYVELKYIYDNYYFEKIEKIKYVGKKATYCLEMPETHNFVQNGLILGNCQGSQWANTIVVFDYGAYILLSSEWVYTAVTRASKRCYLVAETRALRYATTTTKIKGRDTFLKDLLDGEDLCL